LKKYIDFIKENDVKYSNEKGEETFVPDATVSHTGEESIEPSEENTSISDDDIKSLKYILTTVKKVTNEYKKLQFKY